MQQAVVARATGGYNLSLVETLRAGAGCESQMAAPARKDVPMITIQQLLASKSSELFTISADDTVTTALAILSARRIGALLVMDGESLKGIMSERDCALKVALPGRRAEETRVSEIMTHTVITVAPTQPLEDCMQLMTERDIRHLPVMEAGRVVGMISIGDVVKETLKQQRYLIQQLESYIRGAYTGGLR